MVWRLQGTYFESCNCDMLCPCTWSGFTARATNDRCLVTLVYQVADGNVDGVDVSGLHFALVVDAPPVMSEGGWRVGVCLDAAADEAQSEKLGAVVSGQLGGPPAALAPLLGEMLGIERTSFEYIEQDGSHSVRIGDMVSLDLADLHLADMTEPVQLHNIFHPSNTTLTVSPAKQASVDAFGIRYGREGQSGFSAPFSWAA
jgi:hypothetical protein